MNSVRNNYEVIHRSTNVLVIFIFSQTTDAFSLTKSRIVYTSRQYCYYHCYHSVHIVNVRNEILENSNQ